MANNRKNLTEQTVQRLRELITARGLEPGAPFGIEADLEKQLSVSRPVLREAISRLRALGILDSRQSVGLIIGKPDPVGVFEQALEGCAAEAMDMSELAEFRYVLEVGAVESAVRRATDEQVERLHNLAQQIADGMKAGLPVVDIDEIELKFHSTILSATQNHTLIRMHRILAAFYKRAEAEVPGWDANTASEFTNWEHLAIAKAFSQRNAEYARVLLAAHLNMMLDFNPRQDNPA